MQILSFWCPLVPPQVWFPWYGHKGKDEAMLNCLTSVNNGSHSHTSSSGTLIMGWATSTRLDSAVLISTVILWTSPWDGWCWVSWILALFFLGLDPPWRLDVLLLRRFPPPPPAATTTAAPTTCWASTLHKMVPFFVTGAAFCTMKA